MAATRNGARQIRSRVRIFGAARNGFKRGVDSPNWKGTAVIQPNRSDRSLGDGIRVEPGDSRLLDATCPPDIVLWTQTHIVSTMRE